MCVQSLSTPNWFETDPTASNIHNLATSINWSQKKAEKTECIHPPYIKNNQNYCIPKQMVFQTHRTLRFTS